MKKMAEILSKTRAYPVIKSPLGLEGAETRQEPV